MLTIIRNGGKAGLDKVDIPGSKIKLELVRVLKEQGYIKDYKFLENETQGLLRVYLKYISEGNPTIFGIQRVSKPSCRVYSKSKNIKPVLNGLGISIISTSKGLMTDKQAKEANVGGEILCNVW
jgi:small subunit ribosomal protein S8